MQNPKGVSALSIDPALSTANHNVQVSLDYVERDYVELDVITTANAFGEVYPPWHLERIKQAAFGQVLSSAVHWHQRSCLHDTHRRTEQPSSFLTADCTSSGVVVGGWSYDGTNNTEDCIGHGTGIASLVGGRTIGSAPNTTLHAILRVCVPQVCGDLSHHRRCEVRCS
jgi:hypothetical protein